MHQTLATVLDLELVQGDLGIPLPAVPEHGVEFGTGQCVDLATGGDFADASRRGRAGRGL